MSTIITLDGPAGSGKSTAARRLAERLGFDFLDTGAMYRAVAWKCLDAGLDDFPVKQAAQAARELQFEFPAGRVIADGRDVTELIRSEEVSRGASVVAINPDVRSALVDQQRRWADGRDVVSEGRDQGTIVFPDATCKFFLTAKPEIRARRRWEELVERGESADYEEILRTVKERDHRDANRAVGPLHPAADALEIDTGEMSLDEVVDRLEQIVRRKINRL